MRAAQQAHHTASIARHNPATAARRHHGHRGGGGSGGGHGAASGSGGSAGAAGSGAAAGAGGAGASGGAAGAGACGRCGRCCGGPGRGGGGGGRGGREGRGAADPVIGRPRLVRGGAVVVLDGRVERVRSGSSGSTPVRGRVGACASGALGSDGARDRPRAAVPPGARRAADPGRRPRREVTSGEPAALFARAAGPHGRVPRHVGGRVRAGRRWVPAGDRHPAGRCPRGGVGPGAGRRGGVGQAARCRPPGARVGAAAGRLAGRPRHGPAGLAGAAAAVPGVVDRHAAAAGAARCRRGRGGLARAAAWPRCATGRPDGSPRCCP